LLVFGLAFVSPVVLVLLNFANLITAKNIIRSWRMAVFIIAVVAALATPTADPMSMFLVMLPLLGLYFIAALITWLNDKRRERKQSQFDRELNDATANTQVD
jgi:sec-independent protein translocase protein TatC